MLRKLLEGERNGTPDYQEMSQRFAALTRQQLPVIQQILSNLGAVSTVTFKDVSPAGADVYRVTFQRGQVKCGLSYDVGGRIAAISFQPLD